ncbi:hypothetical protein BGW36DRAFT_389679 [Talaromyces proteolyticus]|uniref:Uncharacterized protein n=1 Tax=Talaromyces proteolyticus TaxID=1131652 RepID=A0AAD4KFC6_9EURO|nr:uncharacterized protein BGW36DRAFT_389679 [Talaromyces proteolyticus]KAH8690959.1 hypothetical protein BGW36DRAFT_389679 [Talaromyces proteolyticus]
MPTQTSKPPPPPTTTNSNEADIIFNRANVALARSQRLVASWLPPKPVDDDGSAAKSSAETQRLEDEMFTAVPERLGLGAAPPNADKPWLQADLSANDKLRQQLLGRNYKKVQEQKQKQAQAHGSAAKDRGAGRNNDDDNLAGEEEEDEGEGRSAVGKRKKQQQQGEKGRGSVVVPTEERKEGEDVESPSLEEPDTKKSKKTAASKRKGAGSFLDELLSDRKKNRKK